MRKILSKEIIFVIRIWTIHHGIPTVNTISFCFLSYSLFLPPHQWILDILILRIVVAHQTAKGIIFWLFVLPFWFIFTAISPTKFLQIANIWCLEWKLGKILLKLILIPCINNHKIHIADRVYAFSITKTNKLTEWDKNILRNQSINGYLIIAFKLVLSFLSSTFCSTAGNLISFWIHPS